MSKTKATEAALFIGENEEILFLAFLGRLSGSAAGASSLSGVG